MSASTPLTPAELRRGDVFWLLEIAYASRKYRFATRSVNIESDDGTVHYEGGLDLDVELAFDLLSDSSAEPLSVSFDVVLPDDVAELVEQGHDLSRATGELAMWVVGRTYEQRVVLMSGKLQTPAYGVAGEPISFSLTQDASKDYAVIPAPTMAVTLETWPLHDTANTGRSYPTVIGRPGVTKDGEGNTTNTTGSPALLVQTSGGTRFAVIAGHRIRASTVHVINVTQETSDDLAVVTTTDGLGQLVSVVDCAGFAVEGDELWVRFDGDEGGLPNRSEDADMRGAGEVLLWLLQQSSNAVDLARFADAEPSLNHYKLDFYLDAPATPWDVVADHLLPILPVSLASGPDGLFPIVWRADATASDAVAALTAGPGLVRQGGLQYEGDDVANRITVAFAPRGDAAGEYLRTIVATGEEFPEDSADQLPAYDGRNSRLRYGRYDARVETDFVYDAPTAVLIAQDLVRRRGFRWRSVRYAGGWDLAWLQRGAVVTITDDDVHLAARVALVRDIRYTALGVDLTLVLIENPARDPRG